MKTMTKEEWEFHPDRIKTIAETAIEYIKDLGGRSDDVNCDDMSAIGYIRDLEDLYIRLYNKYLDSEK